VLVVDVPCPLCGQTAPATTETYAEIQLVCNSCGFYSITVGAMTALRKNPARGSLVRAEMERRRVDGNATSRIDMELLEAALKA
jgi:hypothetical protein